MNQYQRRKIKKLLLIGSLFFFLLLLLWFMLVGSSLLEHISLNKVTSDPQMDLNNINKISSEPIDAEIQNGDGRLIIIDATVDEDDLDDIDYTFGNGFRNRMFNELGILKNDSTLNFAHGIFDDNPLGFDVFTSKPDDDFIITDGAVNAHGEKYILMFAMIMVFVVLKIYSI